jgi:Transglycosylase SLT domain
MSAAVCLLASLLSCPYPYIGERLKPSVEHAQPIKRERLVAKRERLGKPPVPVVARIAPNKRLDDLPTPIVARFGPDEPLASPSIPVVARFGTELSFAAAPQIPASAIFSKVDESQKLEDQEPLEKVTPVDRPKQALKTRTKVVLKTTETKTVEKAYVEQGSLEGQWRLSSLFGIRNGPALSQSVTGVSGIEMGKPGYQEVIRAAKMHQVPVDLALRIAKQESRGNCGAKSPAGALGVMQVMPHTGAKHGYSTKQLSNCRTGAEAGVKELKHLLRVSGGDVKQTLTGYNCGERCMFGRRKTLPLETVNYIQAITRN